MKCPECGQIGRHLIDCRKGRCVTCKRFPAVIGPRGSACWKEFRRARQAAVDAALERLGPRVDHDEAAAIIVSRLIATDSPPPSHAGAASTRRRTRRWPPT